MALGMLVPLRGMQPYPSTISFLSQKAQSSSRTQEPLTDPVYAAMRLWFTLSRKEGREEDEGLSEEEPFFGTGEIRGDAQ